METKVEAEINRLMALGYPREDLHVLPDGQITIVPHDEGKSSSITVAKATAPDRLKKMIERKKELDYMATALTVASQPIPVEIEEEFIALQAAIDETQALISS